jgi:formate hydrogenlyase subunit 6/NADH:ubiquinone oxidoreductase subunit I
VYVCGKWIFRFDGGKREIYREHVQRCVHCFACQDLCPTGAIRIVLPKKPRE